MSEPNTNQVADRDAQKKEQDKTSDGSDEIITLKKNTLKSKMDSLAYKFKDDGDLGLNEDEEQEFTQVE